ncbi:ArgE/DapE family deacylase [Brevibacillus choshinensis]|uniref:ArgE/DapE family deacylase n=1 Tax=Brevibacillus choshinensis TaxID=54911 RepID=A0ABX7FWZ3_BRECH|nr:ArgE/DapE family deacylase [Brevibacillus choshinensis]QRG70300.1 ArgE/DapE family deacylase [Brevibacillus choshinensis]
MREAKREILQWVENNQEQMIQFLRELVAIPSDNPPGDCYAIADHIHKRLKDFQFDDVQFLEVDSAQVMANGMIRVSNVISTTAFGEGKGPEISLNAHGDVVAPGMGWTYDPYGGEVVEGKLYGRGAAVSKSDIAAYTFALMAMRGVAEELNGKVSLAFTFDEETGGEIGPKWLLDRGYIKPDMAIAAGFTHSIVNAHNGCLHLEIVVSGKSAHAAAPQTGFDAIQAMNGILHALYAYRESLGRIKSAVPGIESPTLVVGLISGGINTNVVPDRCTIRLDRRLIPEENGEQAEKEIRQVVEQAVCDYEGIEVKVDRILLANSFGPVQEDEPLIQTLGANWKEVMDGQLEIHGVPLYADARHFYEAGVPVVMFGAGPKTLLEANGHRADEHVRIDDLVKATKIVALTLYDLLKNKALSQ